ncbi:hypothetical protein EMIHUDRAFT_241355 [Emiliania huxleyi CCMP1516]|uniref:Secreted protein n=2 Tax=Emiliania huxleyi TaxID=2903 RepID=A0A0D3JCS6_EMIH1|nr:hypothetical protein EMIHUDRAFT_241355 [Emiliania huxleyi CCMP1516]EOD21311.1 hypothetical protein EMIHUDRAFT_241355 [Emiliania huxleyi CCMP1516]|eukprot:XP_005773740.1 hypothetical protein EMIHUDRAFT_241355 [Emiliania huxleyi CCMP1516]
MLVLCATFSRLQWRCTASHGEWHAACAAPRLARTAPESALDGPACAARAPHKLTHRLPFDCRSKPAGFVTPFTQSFEDDYSPPGSFGARGSVEDRARPLPGAA